MKLRFLDHAYAIAIILDDNPAVPVEEALSFEEATKYCLDIPACFAYLDWLTDYGCMDRASIMNAALAAEAEMMKRVLHSIDREGASADVVSWVAWRVKALEEVISGKPQGHLNINGIGVLRYPHRQGAREQALELAEACKVGQVIGFDNHRDEQGEYEWDFRIEGGNPGQVIVTRET